MKLLAAPRLLLARWMPSSTAWLSLILVALLLTLELIGRTAVNDFYDALAGLALACALIIVVARHQRSPFPWLSWIERRAHRLWQRFERLKFDHGIDLRGTPPFPQRIPRWVFVLSSILFAWTVLAGTAWSFYPEGWRIPAVHVFYIGYLVVVSLLWLALITCIVTGVYLPIMLIDFVCKQMLGLSGWQMLEVAGIVGYFLLVSILAVFVPTIVVLALCALVFVVAGFISLQSSAAVPAVLWRSGADQPIYAVPIARLVAGILALKALFLLNLLVTATGGRLFPGDSLPAAMPLTTLLGTAAAWLLPGAALLGIIRAGVWAGGNPARSTPPQVLLWSQNDDLGLAAAKIITTDWGWPVSLAKQSKAWEWHSLEQVGLEIVPPEQSEATEFAPRWPLKVSLEDLSGPIVKDRVSRRYEIQLRRIIARGISTLFKEVRSELGRKRGGGYWFAPHWWFMDHLGREEPQRREHDDQPGQLRPVGRPYFEILGQRARNHLYQIFRSVQVDMIFIETGISHQAINRVLRQIYEVYDRHAGKKRIEDYHFQGIPRVRVMIHDYAPDRQFESKGYPEPHFDDISRARVLHIFRDRGDREEVEDIPFDFSWEPAPTLGIH